jgi:hypothetical protein
VPQTLHILQSSSADIASLNADTCLTGIVIDDALRTVLANCHNNDATYITSTTFYSKLIAPPCICPNAKTASFHIPNLATLSNIIMPIHIKRLESVSGTQSGHYLLAIFDLLTNQLFLLDPYGYSDDAEKQEQLQGVAARLQQWLSTEFTYHQLETINLAVIHDVPLLPLQVADDITSCGLFVILYATTFITTGQLPTINPIVTILRNTVLSLLMDTLTKQIAHISRTSNNTVDVHLNRATILQAATLSASLNAASGAPVSYPPGFCNLDNSCWLGAMLQRLLATPAFIVPLAPIFDWLQQRSSNMLATYPELCTEKRVVQWHINLASAFTDILVLTAAISNGTLAHTPDLKTYITNLLHDLLVTFRLHDPELFDRRHGVLADSAEAWQFIRNKVLPVVEVITCITNLANPFLLYNTTIANRINCAGYDDEGHAPQEPSTTVATNPLLLLHLLTEDATTLLDLLAQQFQRKGSTVAAQYACQDCGSTDTTSKEAFSFHTIDNQPQLFELQIGRWLRTIPGAVNPKNRAMVHGICDILHIADSNGCTKLFQLVSIVEHCSTAVLHYITYRLQGGQWYLCDDSVVTPVLWSTVCAAQAFVVTYVEITDPIIITAINLATTTFVNFA